MIEQPCTRVRIGAGTRDINAYPHTRTLALQLLEKLKALSDGEWTCTASRGRIVFEARYPLAAIPGERAVTAIQALVKADTLLQLGALTVDAFGYQRGAACSETTAAV